MAARHWVGGSASWDAVVGTKWALTAGGAGGQAVPTTSDDVFFDASSGAVTVTSGGTMNCKSLDCTGFTGTLTGTNAMTVGAGSSAGDFILSATMVYSVSGAITFGGSGVTVNITTAGQNMATVTWNRTGGSWKLLDDWNGTGSPTLTLTNGTLDTNGKAINTSGGTFNLSGAGTRTLTLGASVLTFTTWSATTITGLTFNVGTSTLKVNGGTMSDGGLSYNIVDMSTTSYNSTSLSTNITCSSFIANGGNDNLQRGFILSNTLGTPRTITAATVSISNMDFRDIVGAGVGVWTGTSLGDAGGNSGITFTPLTLYWVHSSGTIGFLGGNRFSLSSGGVVGARQAIPGDTLVFDANSFPNTSSIIQNTNNSWRYPTMDFTGATSKGTFQSANRDFTLYGSLTLSSTVGWLITSASIITFTGSGTVNVTMAGKTWAHTGATTFNRPGTVYTLLDAFTCTNASNATVTGAGTTLTSAFDIQFNSLSILNTAVLTHSSGASLIVTGTGTVFSLSATSVVTLNNILKVTDTSATSKTIVSAGKTLGDIQHNGRGTILLTGPLTAGAITLNTGLRLGGYFNAQGNAVTCTSYKDYTRTLGSAGN